MKTKIEVGQVWEVVYPFVRYELDFYEREACGWKGEWKPGVKNTSVPPYGDTETTADGIGRMILTVVSLHKPGKYPTRVFYTRQWRGPDGKVFGKTCLRVISQAGFRNLASGCKYEYELVEAVK